MQYVYTILYHQTLPIPHLVLLHPSTLDKHFLSYFPSVVFHPNPRREHFSKKVFKKEKILCPTTKQNGVFVSRESKDTINEWKVKWGIHSHAREDRNDISLYTHQGGQRGISVLQIRYTRRYKLHRIIIAYYM